MVVRTAEEPIVVLVEDDPNIAGLVDMYLCQDGYRVIQASDAETGLRHIEQYRPKLVILDIGLPGELDGIELCRRLRGDSGGVPIIMLTARSSEIDCVLGLELGADDYVTKPFSPRELMARVRAVLRRTDGASQVQVPSPPVQAPSSPVMSVGELEVDTVRREVRLKDDVVALTAQEFDLIQFLVENRGQALSRSQLLDGAWELNWAGDERTVDVHVLQLRKKLGDALKITTLWGFGYRLD